MEGKALRKAASAGKFPEGLAVATQESVLLRPLKIWTMREPAFWLAQTSDFGGHLQLFEIRMKDIGSK